MHSDVIVVGAGLTGSTLAAKLAKNGIRVCLIDISNPFKVKKSEVHLGRTAALNTSSWDFLKEIGISQSIDESTQFSQIEVWDSRGSSRIEFSSKEIGKESLGSVVSNNSLISELSGIIDSSENINFIIGEITDIKETAEAVELSLNNGDKLSSKLIVGADGANSLVRRLSSIKTKTWSYEQIALVANLQSNEPHLNSARQIFNEEGIIALLPYDVEDFSNISLVWSLDSKRANEVISYDKNTFQNKLSGNTENSLGGFELKTELRSFPLYQMHALSYFSGRSVIVGEAAHTIHPLAGQGLNLSFMDVRGLAEKISSFRRRGEDIGSKNLLLSYQRSRQVHNMGMAGLMEVFKRGFGNQNPWIKLARNFAFDLAQDSSELKKEVIKKAIGFI